MPWRISSAMSQRHEFVMLASQEKANIRQLCRQFEISPTTAYKWLERFKANGAQGLPELSRVRTTRWHGLRERLFVQSF